MAFEPPKAYPVPVKMAFTRNKLKETDAGDSAAAFSLLCDYHTNARFSLGMNILFVDLMPKARSFPMSSEKQAVLVYETNIAESAKHLG